jgi:hypothetical protein
MSDTAVEDNWLDDGKSGQFTAAERRAATTQALPLLATYFASGQDTLTHDDVLSREANDELGDLLQFVQIRVLLSAADRLEPILRGILDRPSFRYHRLREESVGVIGGRLDTIRYLRQRHERQAPRRFPVQTVARSYLLPENVLATWAALTVVNAMRRLPLLRLPVDGPERRRAERAAESLRRIARQPAFVDCVEAAESTWRSGSHLRLRDRVRSRIRGGHVPNVGPYEALEEWVQNFDTKNIDLDPAEVEWMFYDDTFDTKLFELWSLYHLVEALSAELGEPKVTRLLVDRGKHPIAEWAIGDIGIEIWFQAGLATVNVGEPRWTYDPRPALGDRPADETVPAGKFGGIPDIIVVVTDPGGARHAVILDPKLRKRPGVPGAEMYKIIGYLANLPAEHPARGGIIFHGPNKQRSYRISDGGDGEILAVAVDPLDSARCALGFLDLARFVITAVPTSTMTRASGPGDPGSVDSVEQWVESVQEQMVGEMATAISGDGLEHSMKELRSNLLDVWDRIDADTHRMLATAEWFGNEATTKMDHSGPLLGIAAGCERLLRLYLKKIGHPPAARTTFGGMLHSFEDACLNRFEGRPLRAALTKRGIDLNVLKTLISTLFKLNDRYRIPAAHADVLEETEYLQGRAAFLNGPDAALPRIVKVLDI